MEEQNAALRRQLSRTDALLAENERLWGRLAQDTDRSLQPAAAANTAETTSAESVESIRLQAQVDVLRKQNKELETLREDTRQARAALENNRQARRANQLAKTNSSLGPNVPQLEILKAEYWTPNARMDVTDEIADRVRSDSLKTVANNSIRGDPEFGQVKHLTIEYRFAGVAMTNDFQEGALVILPPPPAEIQ